MFIAVENDGIVFVSKSDESKIFMISDILRKYPIHQPLSPVYQPRYRRMFIPNVSNDFSIDLMPGGCYENSTVFFRESILEAMKSNNHRDTELENVMSQECGATTNFNVLMRMQLVQPRFPDDCENLVNQILYEGNAKLHIFTKRSKTSRRPKHKLGVSLNNKIGWDDCHSDWGLMTLLIQKYEKHLYHDRPDLGSFYNFN